MVPSSTREEVVEILNRLFYYTDYRQWENLKSEVFADEVYMDMTSMGAEKAETLTSQVICDMWDAGFKELDAIHHQSGNYIINLHLETATAKAYSIASHYKESATQGKIREFVGSYDFHLIKTPKGWRIDQFTYNLKYVDGNVELK